jgi:DNA-binding transcriptional ArsR family regulator
MTPLEKVAAWDTLQPQQPSPPSPDGFNRTAAGFDLPQFIATHLQMKNERPWLEGGRKWELEVCPFNSDHTGGSAVITQRVDGVIGFKCQHHSCIDKHWRDVRAKFDVNISLTKKTEPIPMPRLFSATELLERDLPILRPLVPGVLHDGLSMLVARPKAGKSWLTLQLAIQTAGGPSIPGIQMIDAGPVLYAALEEPASRTMMRLRQIAELGAWTDRLHFVYNFLPLMGGGAEQIGLFIEQLRPRLVILDTLTALIGAGPRKLESDVFRSQYNEVSRVRKLAEDYKLPVILVHHVRKGISDGAIEAVAGTGGIAAAVDAVWLLRRKPEGEATLEIVGREAEEKTLALRFQDAPFGWSILGDDAGQMLNAERRLVLDLLNDEGGMTPAQIAAAVGKTQPAVRMLLKRMRDDNQVAKQAGKYVPSLSVSYAVTREREE